MSCRKTSFDLAVAVGAVFTACNSKRPAESLGQRERPICNEQDNVSAAKACSNSHTTRTVHAS
jgi:hypothetical protein